MATGRFLSELADVLRAAGLTVVEVDGWQTRARGSGNGYGSGAPLALIWHHTASAPGTSAESNVNYATFYSDNAPICNLYLHADGVVWVCAAGPTNTNGKGGPLSFSRGTVPIDQGNSYFVGIEAGNSGTGEPWPQEQIDAYFALTIALQEALGLADSDFTFHSVYSPGRKIDPATAAAVLGPWRPPATNTSGSWALGDTVAELTERTTTAPPQPPQPPQGGLVFTVLQIDGHAEELGGMADGNGIIAQVSWLSPTRSLAVKSAGAPIWKLSVGDVVNCDLLGPLPPSFRASDFANVIT